MTEKPINLALTMTTTQQRVLAANPFRKYVLLQNDSDAIMYISLGVAAAANRGIRINANGGAFEINLSNPFYGPIYGVSLVNTKILMVQEISR
jgi:hypothetical protein